MHPPTRVSLPGSVRQLCRLLGAAFAILIVVSLAASRSQHVRAAPSNGLITGEIVRMSVTSPGDVWSAGSVEVGGMNVILPRNLLIDLPANRLTLQELFAQASAACMTSHESGLAKGDGCNSSGHGAIISIAANRTNGGNVVAADVFIRKGVELVAGIVTYINYTDGYFRLDGVAGDSTTGTMVRLNDPVGRHTVQQGLGCTGGPNCSPDPRFTEDPDNYTNAFATGMPLCIPSTVTRSFVDTLDLNNNGNTTETLTTQAAANGSGDLLCPATNRTSTVVDDSRRLTPIQLGDYLTAQGNYETVGSAWFLSAWNTQVSGALTTKAEAGQPDYMTISEMFIDGPAFQRQRARARFQGFSTQAVSDIVLFSTHHDPQTNNVHEYPLASTVGCDNAAGAGSCTQVGGVPNIWRIKYDVAFNLTPPAKPDLSPCSQLRADARFAALNLCPAGAASGTMKLEEEFSILSPLTHETQARTGVKLADLARPGGPILHTIDVHGSEAANGQYLFPMGVNLGGIELPDFAEINLARLQTPYSFEGFPWLMDRRLSPGGCRGACESTPQPLVPFPFSGLDPRTQAAGTIFAGFPVPTGSFNDPNFTASTLSNTSNRILSFVDGNIGNFNGDSTVLSYPPVDPPAQPITPALPAGGAPPGPSGATVPGAPTLAAATAGNAQATVNWVAPTSDGGSAITSYSVSSIPAGGVSAPVSGATTTATVTGLTNGTSYTFTVTATNAVGAGTASAPSNAVTPATTPGAPTAVTAVAGNAEATVNWTPPASNGSPIDSYVVTASPGSATATVSGGMSTVTVTGLTNGTSYTFTVKASNDLGFGSASAPSNAVTPSAGPPPPSAPGAPTQALAANTRVTVAAPLANSTVPVTVNWTASASSGITGYQLQQSASGGAFADVSPQPAGTTTTLTVNLALGSGAPQPTYQFQVRACAGATCSAWATGPIISVLPLDNGSASITFSGGWPTATVTGAYGGSVQNQTQSNKRATLTAQTFTATGNLAWVSTLGPDRGIATVSVDGGPATTVDLYAPTAQAAQVVFTSNNLAPGSHTLLITVTGTKNNASSGTRVDVDAIIVIH